MNGPGTTVTVAAWSDVLERFRALVAEAGFDLCAAASTRSYNDDIRATHPDYCLPSLSQHDALVILVGNTRLLWPRLRAGLCADPALAQSAHPVDDYSRLHLSAAADQLARELGVAADLRFSFDRPPRGVAIQRLAEHASLAQRSPVGLSVHTALGPWISLRAALVVDLPAPEPAALPVLDRPCDRCPQPCRAPHALAVASLNRARAEGDPEPVANHYRNWLAVRDACPVGRDHRYGDDQILYHYTKQRDLLPR